MTVLITGAAGAIGSTLARGLPAYGHRLRLLDSRPVEGDDAVQADITDSAALDAAMAGVTAVVHLAGIAEEGPFEPIMHANIEGTYRVFEAARQAGVRRIVYASSGRAVGFTPRAPMVGIDVPPRPDGYYGVSKVFGEALGRLYSDRYGMAVACLRIGTFVERPTVPRHLSLWLSPDDAVRLVHACLSYPALSYAVVYGVSANTRGWLDLEPGRVLGYHPRDDAEAYAAQVVAEHGEPDLSDRTEAFMGGPWTGPKYDAEG
ncbi:MAG: NAD(P)-dependent oxidoreductase [Mycobacteriales bacterium]